MAFLKINGHTVKVRDGTATQDALLNGEFTRGMNTQFKNTPNSKRQWKFSTPPMKESEAMSLMHLINGRGNAFALDSGLTSAAGRTATSGAVYTQYSTTAGDGASVSNAGKFSGSIAVDAAAVDEILIPSDGCPGLYGGTGAGATITVDTGHFFQGTSSLKVVTNASGGVRDGIIANCLGAGLALTSYVGSVWVKSPTASTVRAYLRDSTHGVDGNVVTKTLVANTWTRFEDMALTTGVAPSAIDFYILEDTIDSGITYYCDAWLIELGAKSTAWLDTSRAAGFVDYSAGLVTGAGDFTFNAWVLMPYGTTPALFTIGNSAATYLVRIDNPDGLGTNIRFVTNGPRPGEFDVDSLTQGSLVRGTWTMITCVIRRNPRAGQAKKELWVNGALAQSSSPTVLPDLSTANLCTLGARNNHTCPWNAGRIDEVMVLPYAAAPLQIASWYAATTSACTLPALLCSGDFYTKEVTCYGQVDSAKVVPFYDGSTFVTNGRELSFILEET